MEAMIAVREMVLRNPAVADGSRNMVECLRDTKKSTHTKIRAVVIVGGVAATLGGVLLRPC
jgi:hypothetical protein